MIHEIEEKDSTCQIASPSELEALTEQIDERFAAHLHLVNSDQTRFGSMLRGLTSQKSLKNNQYPKTVIDAHNALGNHKWDSDKKHNKEHGKTNKDEDSAITLTQQQMK